jgi:hypothetical protein
MQKSSLCISFCTRVVTPFADTSIWLVQFGALTDDRTGKAIPFAQLRGLFHRICKLLFFGIKPGTTSTSTCLHTHLRRTASLTPLLAAG